MRGNSRPAGNAERRTSVRKNFGFGSRSLTTDGPLTACVLVIGNEILSGKTQDTNLQFLGNELSKLGIQLEEARVVQDEETAIVTAINECRAKYSYVFTTGGIGPTHDDITASCVAKAFDRKLKLDPEALKRMQRGPGNLNEARRKMATVPEDSILIDNPVSNAPGFQVENVFVLAGVPGIARAMFASAMKSLCKGQRIYSQGVDIFLREGDIAEPLTRIALDNPDVEVGSYPFSREGRYGANLVVRSRDPKRIEKTLASIVDTMKALGAEFTIGPLV